MNRFSLCGVAVCVVMLSAGLIGCHNLTGDQALPAGTQDPSFYNSATGAIGMRNGAISAFGQELPDYIIVTGLLTDELTDVSTLNPASALANGGVVVDPVDERILPAQSFGAPGGYASDATYGKLQGLRTTLLQAIGQLTKYDSLAKDTTVLPLALGRVYRGELYALYGYTEVMLADLFCSGIPLSTIDFQKDFTYKAGSKTADVYWDAISHLDTAFALSADSENIQNLARIGLGRAYLDLAYTNPKYLTAAADDVFTVPAGFLYQALEFWHANTGLNIINQTATVSNREGTYGLPYLADADPRTADTSQTVQVNQHSVAAGFPIVYAAGLSGSGRAPVTVASGVEGVLIQAEAALRSGGGNWLSLLNTLRTTKGLQPLTDPGQSLAGAAADSARLSLVFQERAAWLYMTGHRQGDLRRQLRQYSQYWPREDHVYPSGRYLGQGSGFYGTDVTAPIPPNEYINPLFHGCISRDP